MKKFTDFDDPSARGETSYASPASLFFLITISTLAGVASALLCYFMLGAIPHIPDETSYVFQGRILSTGRLWLAPPQVPEAFMTDHVISTNRWSSIYPPGWPMLLALGWWIQLPWIVNPFLLMLTTFGVWKLATLLYDTRTAAVACVALAISPFVLLMSGGFMAHPPGLCASVWCVFFLMRFRESEQRKDLILASFLAGLALMIRPYTAVALLCAPYIYVAWKVREQFFSRFALSVVTGVFLPLVLLISYNKVVFGTWLYSGYLQDPAWKNFSFTYFFSNFVWHLKQLNASPWGGFVPVFLLLLPLFARRDKRTYDLLLAISCFSLMVFYCFFFSRDIVYSGPRYLYEMMGFLSILAARSFLFVFDWLTIPFLRFALSIALLVFPLGLRLPDQIRYHSQFYHGQDPKLLRMLDSAGVGTNALVLLAGDKYVLRTFFFQNALRPEQGSRVFAIDIPEQESAIRRAYPRNERWRATVELDPLPGPNKYTDRWRLRTANCVRLKN